MNLEYCVFDLEIIKAIPPKDGIFEPGIEYCTGWGDYSNMGISVISFCELKVGKPLSGARHDKH